jgi:hypothetical protein
MPNGFTSLNDLELTQRLQSILINAAEGRRSVGDDAQYSDLRKEFLRRKLEAPGFVRTHPSVDSFSALIKGTRSKADRVAQVRDQFAATLVSLEEDAPLGADSSAWTGIQTPAAKLTAVRALLPLAQAAVEGMIAALEEPGDNGGPVLDERAEAIDNLRALHKSLGDLLQAADSGHLDDQLGEGLAAEAARYAKRAAQALKSDPMPYVASSLLLGLLTTCGLPGIGGYLGGVALTVRKNAER